MPLVSRTNGETNGIPQRIFEEEKAPLLFLFSKYPRRRHPTFAMGAGAFALRGEG
jgi:hypothetical protein